MPRDPVEVRQRPPRRRSKGQWGGGGACRVGKEASYTSGRMRKKAVGRIMLAVLVKLPPPLQCDSREIRGDQGRDLGKGRIKRPRFDRKDP